jgi:hypothetical protein
MGFGNLIFQTEVVEQCAIPNPSKLAPSRLRLDVLLVPATDGQSHSIDIASSRLQVHAFKSWLFSGFAHNHEIDAPISEGNIDDGSSRVKFAVDARRMKVLDPQLKPDKRLQVQERMVGSELLDASRFPQITFESTAAIFG